ncbi:MAG: hypothetical protein U9Q06_00410 [Nanoarchaeota archaeon]|nr:hypothetical protein [Nanoarchaeota archaeon]
MAKKNQKSNSSPIYSKLNYKSAYAIKKNILELQADLLQTAQAINHFKLLRKKEYILKVKLKNTLKETGQAFTQLINSVPQTTGIKKTRRERSQEHENPKNNTKELNIEAQLQDIKHRLQQLA